MTSKERVRAAIARQPVDKVPLGFYLADHDIISRVIGRPTYVRNKIRTQLALWEGRRDEVAENWKQDTADFYRKLDCVDLLTFKEAGVLPPRGYEPERPRKIDDCHYEDKQGRIWQLAPESDEITVVHDPTPKVEEFTPEMFPLPDPAKHSPPDESCFEACDYLVQALGMDRYILAHGELDCMPLLGGMQCGLMQWALAPAAVRAAARQHEAIHRLNDARRLRPGTDGVLIEQDMAGI